jgi:tetratricopeptide (TPR) repeat protein
VAVYNEDRKPLEHHAIACDGRWFSRRARALSGARAAPARSATIFAGPPASASRERSCSWRATSPKAKERFGKALATGPELPGRALGMGHVDMREGKFEARSRRTRGARTATASSASRSWTFRPSATPRTQRTIATLRDNLRNCSPRRRRTPPRDPTQIDAEIATIEDQIHRLEAVDMPSRDKPTEPPGEIYFHMGNAQFRLDRIDEAIASWETCAVKSPKFAMVHNNLAVAYWKKGRLDDAKKGARAREGARLPREPAVRRRPRQSAAAAEGIRPAAPSATAPAAPAPLPPVPRLRPEA